MSAFAGDGAVVDGVDRTIVVTGQAAGALAVMLPLGRGSLDIVDRTDLRTLATLDTDIGVDHELLVRNHPFVEIAANDIGVESGGGTLFQRNDALPTILDDGNNLCQLLAGVGYLAGSLLLRICVHERQADIRLGHDDRIECFCT